MFVAVLLAIVALFLLWVFVVRPRLRPLPAFARFFDWIEPIEQALWARSRTILVGRIYWIAGLVVGIYDLVVQFVATGANLTPITSKLLAYFPPDYQGLAIAGFTFGTGLLMNKLRAITTEALSDKS